MTHLATAEWVSATLDAVRSCDYRASLEAMANLAAQRPEEVIDELVARISAASSEHGDRPLESSVFLPDPTMGTRLVQALLERDAERIHVEVDGDYPEFLARMVCTLAALEA